MQRQATWSSTDRLAVSYTTNLLALVPDTSRPLVTGLTDAVEWYTYMYEFSEEELAGMEPVHTDDEILDAILRGGDDES